MNSICTVHILILLITIHETIKGANFPDTDKRFGPSWPDYYYFIQHNVKSKETKRNPDVKETDKLISKSSSIVKALKIWEELRRHHFSEQTSWRRAACAD